MLYNPMTANAGRDRAQHMLTPDSVGGAFGAGGAITTSLHPACTENAKSGKLNVKALMSDEWTAGQGCNVYDVTCIAYFCLI